MSATNTLENSPSNPVPRSANEKAVVAPRRRRRWKEFVRDICLYVLIYVVVSGFLIGPMFWTWYGAVYVDGPKWVARFFLPLAFLCEICPPLSWLVNAWVNWWIL